MNIGDYQQTLKQLEIDYVLNETPEGMQVIASVNNKIVIKTFK